MVLIMRTLLALLICIISTHTALAYSVENVQAQLNLTDSVQATVDMQYALSGYTTGEVINLSMIAYAPVSSSAITVEVNNRPVPVKWKEGKHMLTARFVLNKQEEYIKLTVSYAFHFTRSEEIKVPLPYLSVAAEQSAEKFFVANILLPEGLMIQDMFPSVPLQHLNKAGSSQVKQFTLQVMPSLLRLKLVPEQAVNYSALQLMDAGLLGVLVLLLVLGWVFRKKLIY